MRTGGGLISNNNNNKGHPEIETRNLKRSVPHNLLSIFLYFVAWVMLFAE